VLIGCIMSSYCEYHMVLTFGALALLVTLPTPDPRPFSWLAACVPASIVLAAIPAALPPASAPAPGASSL